MNKSKKQITIIVDKDIYDYLKTENINFNKTINRFLVTLKENFELWQEKQKNLPHLD